MILFPNLEAFPIAHQIGHTSSDVEKFCIKDNNVIALCEVASNSCGSLTAKANDPHDFGSPRFSTYALSTSILDPCGDAWP